MTFYHKYLKYKTKYLQLKNQIGGKKTEEEIKNKEKELKKYIYEEVTKFNNDNNLNIIIEEKQINIGTNKWNWEDIKKINIKMQEFFNFRLHLVDILIDKIFDFYGCTTESCTKSASGSVGDDANLFSDYDLTITEHNFLATKIIQTFNSVIEETFGSTPFEVFDTNLYGYSGLIPQSLNFKNNKTWTLDLFGKHFYLPLTEPNKEQDKWALRRLITFTNHSNFDFLEINKEWDDLTENTIGNINIKTQSELYIDKMKIFEKLMIDNEDDKISEESIQNINNIRNHIANSLSFMNYYGDETYFTVGSFMHVVGSMFYYRNESIDNKKNFLSISNLIHSMIENFSYFIHSIEKSNDIIVSVKYLERFMDAYKLLKIKNNFIRLIEELKIINETKESNNNYFKHIDMLINNYNDFKKYISENNIFSFMRELKSNFRNATDESIINYLKKTHLNESLSNGDYDISHIKDEKRIIMKEKIFNFCISMLQNNENDSSFLSSKKREKLEKLNELIEISNNNLYIYCLLLLLSDVIRLENEFTNIKLEYNNNKFIFNII